MARSVALERWFLVLTLTLLTATSAAAQTTVVVGKGRAAADVAAVQAAVDRGGTVYLRGAFSFDQAPVDDRTILITKAVAIIGRSDARGNMPSISGGVIPFNIVAPGMRVTIEGIRVVASTAVAIRVISAAGLRIANVSIERVKPMPLPTMPESGAFGIAMGGGSISGDVTIEKNSFDVGGTSGERSGGIVSSPQGFERGVRIRIAQNFITNTTAHGIDLRNVMGSANIESNMVIAGRIGSQPAALADSFVDGIRCLGSGNYRIALNWVDVGYENAAGIRLQGNVATVPVTAALVTGNYVRMTAPSDVPAGSENAGIELRRATVGVVVDNNLIHGVGRTALSVASEPGRISEGATLWFDTRWFSPGPTRPGVRSGADVSIAPGSIDTRVTGGPGSFSVDNQGIRTVIEHWAVTP